MKTTIRPCAATALLAGVLGSMALPALALAPLQGRTMAGDRVDAYDASAVMIYDPNQDLTWLRDWNVNGQHAWQDQVDWASGLTVGTFGGWSLPSALNQDGSGPCEGYNCTGSQMGFMYYEILGNTAGPFQNMQDWYYWTGTAYAPNPGDAWAFESSRGNQQHGETGAPLSAVAVRFGDVAAPIPEPQAWAMLLMGLGAGALVLRMKRR